MITQIAGMELRYARFQSHSVYSRILGKDDNDRFEVTGLAGLVGYRARDTWKNHGRWTPH